MRERSIHFGFAILDFGRDAIVGISPITILKGELSTRTWNLVKEWALEHESELLENWELARLAQTLEPIEPLE